MLIFLPFIFNRLHLYLLLLYAAAAVLLSFHSLSKKLAMVGLIGIFIAGETWRWDKNSFEEIFYGSRSYHNSWLVRRVGFGQLILAIVAVMGSLVYIARDKDLDGKPAPETQAGDKPCGSREPEFLEAEILPPEGDKRHKCPPQNRRLRD